MCTSVISRDVQFVENESWDGTVDINAKIVSNVDNDDMEEEVVQIPHVSQLVGAPLTPMTPRHGLAQGPSTQVAAQATPTSTPRGQQTPSSISSRSTLIELVKTRILCFYVRYTNPVHQIHSLFFHYFLLYMIH